MRRLMMSSASARLFQAVLVSACDVLCIASGVVRYFRQCWLERPLNAWSFGRRLVRRTRHTGFVPFGAFVGAELGGLTRHGHLPRRGQRSLHTESVCVRLQLQMCGVAPNKVPASVSVTL